MVNSFSKMRRLIKDYVLGKDPGSRPNELSKIEGEERVKSTQASQLKQRDIDTCLLNGLPTKKAFSKEPESPDKPEKLSKTCTLELKKVEKN